MRARIQAKAKDSDQREYLKANMPSPGKAAGAGANFADHRQAAVLQHKLGEIANRGSRSSALSGLVQGIDHSPRMLAQRRSIERMPGKLFQRMEDDEPVQSKSALQSVAARDAEGVADAGSHVRAQAGTVQRALPPGTPNTGGHYNAQYNKASMKPYKGGRPSKFSTTFKNACLGAWGGTYDSQTGLWHIATPDSKVAALPSNAIQIDHKTPWATIESYMTTTYADNSDKGTRYADSKGNYTVYAARMYYHDFDNLKPMAPSDNASKGASTGSSSVELDPDVQESIQEFSMNAHAVMNMAKTAHDHVAKITNAQKKQDAIDTITDELQNLTDPMEDAHGNMHGLTL